MLLKTLHRWLERLVPAAEDPQAAAARACWTDWDYGRLKPPPHGFTRRIDLPSLPALGEVLAPVQAVGCVLHAGSPV
jgi:hypothetical protein